jgi:ankyrin repeat protein
MSGVVYMKLRFFCFVFLFSNMFFFCADAVEAKSEELGEAVAKGDLQKVRSLIAAGADLNAPDPKEGLTPLIKAVQFRQTAIVEELVKAGADVNRKDEINHSTPLLWAVRKGEVEEGNVTAPIEKKYEIAKSKSARIEIVKLLIRSGADLQARNANGESILTVAKQAGYDDVVEILKKEGAREHSNPANVSAEGWIEGRVKIGPLRPGPERLDEPEPDMGRLFSRHKIVILSEEGSKKVKEVSLDAKGNYKVSLPPGKYQVDFQPHDIGIGMRFFRPQIVTVQADKTTRHDIAIDTGMR